MTQFRFKIRPLFLIALILGVASWALAQTNVGVVSGTVQDPSGAVIENAVVSIHNVATGVLTTATTDKTGFYRLPSLAPGEYTLTVTSPGFKKARQVNLQVLVGTTLVKNIAMETGHVSQTVTVSGNALTLQTQTSDVTSSVTPHFMQNLPVSAQSLRTPVDFIFLTPGVTGGGPLGNNTIKFAGGQALGGVIMFDGLPDNTTTGNNFDAAGYTPSVDAIQEFSVILSGMPAQYGHTSGGIENFVTKSGTNHYHGTVYDFFKNTALDANNWFTKAHGAMQCSGTADTAACRSKFQRGVDRKNDYGVTFGGPLSIPKLYNARNRTFGFFSFEQLPINGGGIATSSVPTVANRNGDFTNTLNTGVVLGINPCDGKPMYQGEIFDPTTTREVGGVLCRDSYPTINMIPAGDISTVANNLLTNYIVQPQNGQSNNNYFLRHNNPDVLTTYTIRVDEHMSQKNSIFSTYSSSENDNSCPNYTSFPNPSDNNCAQNDQIQRFVRIGYDHVFTPNLLNHFEVGMNRNDHKVISKAAQAGVDYDHLIGLTGTTGRTFPGINYGEGYSGLGQGTDLRLADNQGQAFDNFDWTHGRSNFKFGGEFRYYQFSIPNTGGNAGTFNFSRNETSADVDQLSVTGNSFASFLTGQVSSAKVAFQLHAPRSSGFYYAFYAQDDYRATSNLTLNVGLRYNIELGPREAEDDNSRLNLTTPDVAAGNLPGALEFAGTGPGRDGHSSRFVSTYMKAIAPRLGFAYTPPGLNGKTVVRGSYDLIYSPLPISSSIGTPAPGVNPISPVATGFNVNANYNDSGTNFIAPFTLDQGFPAYSLQPNLDPDQANGTPNAVYTPSKFGRPASTSIWELEVQQQLPLKIVATVGYLGQSSAHTASNVLYLNNLDPKYFGLGNQLTETAGPTAPVDNPYTNFQTDFKGNGTVAQALRPYPQYKQIGTTLENLGKGTYEAAFIKLQRQFSNGFSLLAAYTHSKTLTDADSSFPGVGAGTTIQDPSNLNADYSYSTEDLPDVLTISYVYELPFGRNKRFLSQGSMLNRLAGGWQISGIHRYESSEPEHFACAPAIPGTDTCTRYNLVGPIKINNSAKFDPFTDARYSAAAFQNPNLPAEVTARGYAFGNSPREIGGNVRSPAYLDEDFSLIKRTPIKAGTTLEFRVDAFNAFNRHIFGGGDTNPADGQFTSINSPGRFGQVTGLEDSPRTLQLMLKVLF